MGKEWMVEGFRQLRLAAAWRAYADALAPLSSTLAQRVRQHVVDPFLQVEWIPGIRGVIANPALTDQIGEDFLAAAAGSPLVLRPDEIALAWLGQARAVMAWPFISSEAADLQQQATQRRRWAELHDACGKSRHQLETVRGKGRFSFLYPAQLTGAMADAVAALANCQSAFAAFGDGPVAAIDLVPAERRVQDLLNPSGTDWMPQQLADVQQKLTRFDPTRHVHFFDRITTSRWADWSRWLERELPGTEPMTLARLILIRAVVESIDVSVSDPIDEMVRRLLACSGLEIALIRAPDQQASEWFAMIADPCLETPVLARAGMVIAGRLCFPRAELRVPTNIKIESQPIARTPEEHAVAELDRLIVEAGGTLDAQSLEERWIELKAKCDPEELEPTPSRWTFLRLVSWEDLELDQNTLATIFHSTIARGCIQIKAFGLRRRGGDTIRECELRVSAGASPIGFDELCRLVESPANSGEERLKQRLQGWPRACLQDAFDVAAERLFIDFWGPLGDEMRLHNSDGARRFGEQLSLLLEHELQLQTFYPETFQDYPTGWLLLDSDHGGVTGRVRRVIRPGVKDESDNLHVPAIVEID